jgi:hypothetical protein
MMIAAKLPTEETYHLKCRVVIKDVSYEDQQSKGNTQATAKMVFLVPESSTQKDLFLAAWLPETVEEWHEVALMIGAPINGPCRAAVMRKNARMDEHHIFMMSVGAGEDLIQEIEGQKKRWTWLNKRAISVTVLPEAEDQLLDLARDPLNTAGILKKYGK